MAGWLDLATRELVGWAAGEHHDAQPTRAAPAIARDRGALQPGCIIHSDRGGEYTDTDFKKDIHEYGYMQSMGRTGSCYDNAAGESLWAVIKSEIGTTRWPDRAAARAALFEYIEIFYNRQRLRKHPEWGYLTPHEARQRFRHGHSLAA